MFAPKTATTFRTLSNGASILKQTPAPTPDIDAALIQLPTASDYLMPTASIDYLIPKQLTDNSALKGSNWIQQQEDNSYSLQLVAASDAGQLEKYCNKFNICHQSAIYQTNIKGKNIVRLLYGVFPNRKSANIAISKLPPSLQKTKPWARQFKGIKQEI